MKRVDASLLRSWGTPRRDLWVVLVPVLLVIGAAFTLTLVFLKPAPPTELVMRVRGDEGGYAYYAKKYQEFLAANGVKLEIRAADDDVDTLAEVADPGSGVDIAFDEGGPVKPGQDAGLVSLGSLYYEPLWIFYRGDPIDDLAGLRGKRIAAGPEESGTRALAAALLKAAAVEPAQWLPLGRKEAVAQLTAGTIDAALMISPAEAPIIRQTAALPGVHLLSLARAEGYARRLPYLTKLTLPRGTLDLAADVPDHDVDLVAPTAILVARDALHPALAYLLLRAESSIHTRPGLLAKRGTFPAPLESGLPLADEAVRYFKSGSPFLQRYLPFWAANLVDRLWIMLVPLLAVLLPLLRLLPPLYRWRVRSRVYRWYATLKEAELQLEDTLTPPQLERMLARLDEVERAVNRIQVPLAYTDNLYGFREHVDLVRRRIAGRLERALGAPAADGSQPLNYGG